MPEVLTFTLAAPLGAMGAVAVGEQRGGWDRPGRSAVLGLLAACLGLERSDDEAHVQLDATLGVALRRDAPAGSLLVDFHTAQVPPTRRGVRFATRAEELAAPRLETVLTRRDYRADLHFTVAVWRRSRPGRWDLQDLAAAMRTPRFTPYLGRKSCPLGLPMAPRVDQVPTVAEAIRVRDAEAARTLAAMGLARGTPGSRLGPPTAVWTDAPNEGEPPLGLAPHRIETRRDRPLSRRRWQFGLRDEVVADWVDSPAAGAA